MELINRTPSWEIDSYSMSSPKVGPTKGNVLIKTDYNHPLSLIVRDKSLLTPSFFRVALASVQIPMNCSTHGRIIPKAFPSGWCRPSHRYFHQVFITKKGAFQGIDFQCHCTTTSASQISGRFLPWSRRVSLLGWGRFLCALKMTES